MTVGSGAEGTIRTGDMGPVGSKARVTIVAVERYRNAFRDRKRDADVNQIDSRLGFNDI
jgi:hypothetical protein